MYIETFYKLNRFWCKIIQVISCDDVYGGTQRYFRKVAEAKHKMEFSFVDLTDFEAIKKSVKQNTKVNIFPLK